MMSNITVHHALLSHMSLISSLSFSVCMFVSIRFSYDEISPPTSYGGWSSDGSRRVWLVGLRGVSSDNTDNINAQQWNVTANGIYPQKSTTHKQNTHSVTCQILFLSHSHSHSLTHSLSLSLSYPHTVCFSVCSEVPLSPTPC